jgi:membrane associated rhomboid family serine protease
MFEHPFFLCTHLIMSNFALSHTLSLILITVVVSLLAFSQSRILSRLIFWSPAIRQGQVDRFITYGFVHADGFHLLFNMLTLFFFGSFIEQFYRQYAFNMGFALFYLGGLIFSIIPSYLQHRHDQQWMSLGASGAVSAVLFAFILFQPWQLILVFFIPVPAIIFAILYVAYSIWAEKRGQTGINHSAHLWGAAYGVICTVLLEPQVLLLFLNRLTHPSFL